MDEDFKGSVFVLGAGFTRAFLPSAPLLVDTLESLGLVGLEEELAGLPQAGRVLGRAVRDPSRVNVEDLISRSYSMMPYDSGKEEQFSILYRKVVQRLLGRLAEAIESPDPVALKSLNRFAKVLLNNGCNCITFNYDDLLDKELFRCHPIDIGRMANLLSDAELLPKHWSPKGGYGFYCRPTESLVCDMSSDSGASSLYLLKLHGSMNWRIKLGSPERRPIDSVLHGSNWFPKHDTAPRAYHEYFLEPDPFIVPPVLSKNDLTKQPLLRLLWTYAFRLLSDPPSIVFIGYSMPASDNAARWLFGEAIEEIGPRITVVNFASTRKEKDAIMSRYQAVLPGLEEKDFFFEGAVQWIQKQFGS